MAMKCIINLKVYTTDFVFRHKSFAFVLKHHQFKGATKAKAKTGKGRS